MVHRRTALTALLLAACLTRLGPAKAEEPVTLFAAASLTTVIADLAEAWRAAGNPQPRGVFASSSTLAKQIERGAPADIYIAANPAWMDYLEERDLLAGGSRVELAGNRLVLIAPLDSPMEVEIAPGFDLVGALDLSGRDSRLALGDPEHVPAGIYARAALRSLGAWDAVAGRRAYAADVRAALALVERGAAAAGAVYASDALISRRVKVVGQFPETSHPPIRYPAAIVAGRDRPAVRAFYAFLRSPEAAALFEARGFLPLPPTG